jgi:hypothetical protein
MAKFAPVAPAHLLRRLRTVYGDEALGWYHLVLAHDVVDNASKWQDLLPDNSVVIIDNGIIELGAPVVWETMKAAYDILGNRLHRVMVLPDRFDDGETTYLGSLEYYNRIKNKVDENAEYMFVIQSRYTMGIELAIEDMKRLFTNVSKKICWVAIPRRISNNVDIGTRMTAVLRARLLKQSHPQINIHLFGFSNNIRDDMLCSRELGVAGIDSTVPLRLGQQDKQIDLLFAGDQAGPRGTFWTDPHPHVHYATFHNLQKVRKHIAVRPIKEDL